MRSLLPAGPDQASAPVYSSRDDYTSYVSSERSLGQVAVPEKLSADKSTFGDDLLASVVEHLSDAVVIADMQGRFVCFNQAAVRTLAIRAKQIAGENCLDACEIFLPDGQTVCSQHDLPLTRALHGEFVRDRQLIIRNQNRDFAWVNASASPLFDKNGVQRGAMLVCQDITTKKGSRRQHDRRLEEKASLFECAGAGIYGVDRNGCCTFMNRAAAAMLGYDVSELLGRNIHETVHYAKPDGSPYPPQDCPITQSFVTGRSTRSEDEVFWRRNGTPFPVEIASEPIFVEGVLHGCVVAVNDISARKRAQKAMALLARTGKVLGSSLDYRHTLQQLADLIVEDLADWCVCDLFTDGVIERVGWALAKSRNAPTLDRIRTFAPKLGTDHPTARVLATSQPLLLRDITDEWIRRIAVNAEHESVVRDLNLGTLITAPIEAGGRTFGSFTLGVPKTWGRQLDEEDLELACEIGRRAGQIIDKALLHQAVADSEERHRVLAETVPNLVWTCRPDGGTEYFNHRWIQYTGIPEGKQLGDGWLQVIHPADRERVREAWNTTVSKECPYDIEYRIRGADGNYRWFKARSSPLRDRNGKIIRWFGTSTDIEDQKLIEDRLAQQTEELARSNSELQQFAYIVAHDLREPLRTVGSFTELLGRRLPREVKSAHSDLIDFIVGGVERMESLIEGLLSFATVSTRDSPRGRVDVNTVLNSALNSLDAMVREAGVEIRAGSMPVVIGDEILLLQVFQNLIGNALKYRAATEPRVEIEATRQSEFWKIMIRDNGPGIDSLYHDQIFGLFKRLHGREVPGIGLGLASCRKIIEKHGGRIWVESAPGEGARFFFTLKTAD
jgi:PAS domain S-box-containing protein